MALLVCGGSVLIALADGFFGWLGELQEEAIERAEELEASGEARAIGSACAQPAGQAKAGGHRL